MGILQAVTLGIALLGAGLGVFNTIVDYRRGRVFWRVRPVIEKWRDGYLRFGFQLVNPGRIPVAIEEVFLAGPWPHKQRSARLADHNGNPLHGFRLMPGTQLTVMPVEARTLHAVLMFQPLTIVAESQDGRRVKARCPGLREVYDQLQAAQAQAATKR